MFIAIMMCDVVESYLREVYRRICASEILLNLLVFSICFAFAP